MPTLVKKMKVLTIQPSAKRQRKARSKKNGNGRKATSARSGVAIYQTVPAPVASQVVVTRKDPSWSKSPGGFRTSGSELISLIAGNTTFGVTSISINPGLYAAFPQLSSMANCFQKYRFHNLRYHIVPNKGTAVAGVIMLSPQRDPADATPATELAMCQYPGTKEYPLGDTSSSPSGRMMSPFNKPTNWLFTRPGNLASNLDVKTYDCMDLLVGVAGTADTSTVARLWVDYDVEFMTVQPNSSIGQMSTLIGVPVNNANLFGTTTVNPSSGGKLNATASTNTITFGNIGEYLVSLYSIGTVISALTGTTSTATYTAGLVSAGTNQTTARNVIAVRTTAPDQTLVLTCTATTVTTFAATITNCDYAAVIAAGSY